MKNRIIVLGIIAACIALSGCTNSSNQGIEIGDQVWMASNLNVTHFRNGDVIPQAKSNVEWRRAGENGEPAWCYYNNETNNGKRYGKLYNWFAVTDPRGLAPEGWRIPNNDDWDILVKYVSEQEKPSKALKESGTKHWTEPNSKAHNSTGFTALPGGYRSGYGTFQGINSNGFWWTISEDEEFFAWYRYINFFYPQVFTDFASKTTGFAVRCIQE